MDLNKKFGFTLIELLVTIAIIGVLATLAMAGFRYARDRAKTAKAEHTIGLLRDAISMLANDSNQWPGHQTVNAVCSGACGGNEICGPDADSNDCTIGLDDKAAGLIKDDSAPGTPFPNWGGPYMKVIPLDPWGHEYYFDTDYNVTVDGEPCNGGSGCLSVAVIGSYGPDGQGLNDYNADDIIQILAR